MTRAIGKTGTLASRARNSVTTRRVSQDWANGFRGPAVDDQDSPFCRSLLCRPQQQGQRTPPIRFLVNLEAAERRQIQMALVKRALRRQNVCTELIGLDSSGL